MSARPIPPIHGLTAPYWEAARRNQLVMQICDTCTHRPFPPRAHCPTCGAGTLSWAPVSGRGTVYSFTVAHRPPHPVFAEHCPLVIAIVELDEGPRLITNIVAGDPADVTVGMAVRVFFEPIDDSDVALPVFVPL